MIRRILILGLVAGAAAGAWTGIRAARAQDAPSPPAVQDVPFPHAAHQGLFPDCAACHAGIPSEDKATIFSVTAKDCAGCHDGDTMPEIEWAEPAFPAGNLKFSHEIHVGENGMKCGDCHQAGGSTDRMDVVLPKPEICMDCHGEGPHTSSVNECRTCHDPIAQAPQVPASAIAGYPRPADHGKAGFLFTHGIEAEVNTERCAVCHARESCKRCHLNADRVAAIGKLASDSRFASLTEGKPGSWPAPPSHLSSDWVERHGAAARTKITECANCHLRGSCAGCHGEKPPMDLSALPVGKPGERRGVGLAGVRPPDHVPGFATHHDVAAASGALDCRSCHSQSWCADCHTGDERPRFHPPNYLTRHAAEAYARDTNCANCHSTEVFCRDCHMKSGLSVGAPATTSYHDAQPLWLLNHGQAAREGMESCASCHQQTDCLRCHSARSGWHVDPHGPDFDPNRYGNRATFMCRTCHFGDPRGD